LYGKLVRTRHKQEGIISFQECCSDSPNSVYNISKDSSAIQNIVSLSVIVYY